MLWYQYVAYFFGGATLANCFPHFIMGVTGRPFPSPFASPPFKGLSSPTVNVAWGLINMVIAYLLLVKVGEFDLQSIRKIAVSFVGFAFMAFNLARSLERLSGARP